MIQLHQPQNGKNTMQSLVMIIKHHIWIILTFTTHIKIESQATNTNICFFQSDCSYVQKKKKLKNYLYFKFLC